ncbi:hypothetical protein QWA68_012544 [Fusarium oxysporum]|nr:hypothetical protein QWA68_012544 [Fusarium oxysporum]
MATLTRSDQSHGSYVKLEPGITITYPALSTEWTVLQAFRLHHQRLERKTKYQPLRRSFQGISTIKWQNDLALFDTHLRHILTRGDLDTIVKHKLKEQEQISQSQLVSICTLLNRLTNSQLLSGLSEDANLNEQDSPYPRLLLLAQILNDTEWNFDLTTGQGRVLFVLDSEQDANEANNVVRTFDEFFSQVMLPMRVEKVQQPTSEARESRLGLRDRAVKGLEYLFLRVPQGQSQFCQGHRILIKLPDWNTIDRPPEPETALELFFSTCASSKEWHQAWCAIRSTAESDDEDVCDFCDDLRDAKTSGKIFRFIARDNNLFISSNDDNQRRARPNYQPTRSLYDLIENQSFCESRNINPFMPLRGGLRTHRIQHQNCRSWVGNDSNDVHDYDGHGTRIAELILRAAPEADIYICKVFNGRSLLPDEVEGIAKAITYAVDVWDVDIISMSFGLTSDSLINDTKLKVAYRNIDAAIQNAKSTIFLAAAANHGSHGPRTFPANHDSVICIHASDGNGKDGGISPDPESTDDNFMILGIALELGGGRKSGTSYAAPMAASMAAHIIYTAENLLDLTDTARYRLRTGRGMREMFRLMCGRNCTGGYRFLAPWVELWTKDWHLDHDRIKFIETRILTTEVFKF